MIVIALLNRNPLFIFALTTLMSFASCKRQSGSGIASADSPETPNSNLASLDELTAAIVTLRSRIDKDFNSPSLSLADTDHKIIIDNLTMSLKAIDDARVKIRSNNITFATVYEISYLSGSNCPMNSGRCPFALIRHMLSDYGTAYDNELLAIDTSLSSSIEKINELLPFSIQPTSLELANEDTASHPDLPRSGYEMPYEPSKWNDNGSIQHNTNCYAYSLNLQKNPATGQKFPLTGGFALQPGDFVKQKMAFGALNDPNGTEIINL